MFRPAKWTIHRFAAAGVAAGLAALLMWSPHLLWPRLFALPFVAALAVASGCGGAMLLITLRDLKYRSGRGSRLRPIRTFDMVLGLTLAVPSALQLRATLPDLPMLLGF